MGFFDLCGDLGRQFGSVGVALDGIHTRLSITDLGPSKNNALIQASGIDADRVQAYAARLCTEFAVTRHLKIDIAEAIRPHAGLGSGTQLALAVGHALAAQFRLELSPADIAKLLGRGRRSGIGISTFSQGGFHIDCGNNTADTAGHLPPVFFSRPFPQDWRFILLFDNHNIGCHGTDEKNAFATLKPMPAGTADKLCRLTLMQVIPGLIHQDVHRFGRAITQIQAHVGDHFSPMQGGRFVSPAVREQLHWYEQQGAAGFGQSSWGPTGFVLCESQDIALQLVDAAAQAMPENPCEVMITGASNRGASINETR